MTEEEIEEMLQKANAYTPDNAGNYVYRFTVGYSHEVIQDASEPDAKAKFFKKVKEDIDKMTSRKQNVVGNFVQSFERAKQTGRFEFYHQGEQGGDPMFLENMMKPYLTREWEIIPSDEAANFGVVLLQN